MQLLAVKLILSPTLVGAASLAGRRWGPRVAGVAAALPIVAGPVLLFYALEQGLAFAALAARSTLVGLVPLTAFCLGHAVLARAAIALPRRLAATLGLVCGWTAFLVLASLLRPLRLPTWACTGVGAGALITGLALIPEVPADGRRPLRHHPVLELSSRMALAALLVTALTGLAAALGPAWSGILAPFPVATSVVVLGAHLADGPESLPGTLRAFFLGLSGFVAFLTVLAYGLQPLGVVWAFTLGAAASVAITTLATVRFGRSTCRRPAAPTRDDPAPFDHEPGR